MTHIPVLLNETLKFLSPGPNENFVDGTIGGGGHSLAILQRTKPEGKILGIDWSCQAIVRLKDLKSKNPDLDKRLFLVSDNFANISSLVSKFNFYPINGVLFDLGLSSDILQSKRGFSYQGKEPLDMRYNPKAMSRTAADILNKEREEEIYYILKNFGQERFSSRIARAIVLARQKEPFVTTDQLRKVVIRASRGHFKISILARVFQALRIAVNHELENLETGLEKAVNLLSPQGRIVVISYHSLEDRIVKNKFKQANNLEILTKKPIRPIEEEVAKNPRSRSAKLRAAKKNDI